MPSEQNTDRYTPTTEEVRAGLIAGQLELARQSVDDPDTVIIETECGKQFDRWLADLIRRERGVGWDECSKARRFGLKHNPYTRKQETP